MKVFTILLISEEIGCHEQCGESPSFFKISRDVFNLGEPKYSHWI
ncbi:hypothetical protein T4A_12601 [Trichinella pseudospiralis]|uniref:Uncharacterized protein n=1 Tax=Trichinella pseudospiralis TaxID=6337 RepID=A0A0V1DV00_TRIPS|nr:hypothetical protein T4A_12601 [Trichinella pseudospiralis]